MKVRFVLAVISTFFLLATAGCSDGESRLDKSNRAFEDSFRQKFASYEWAPNYRADPDEIVTRMTSGESLFNDPAGHATLMLESVQQCSWFMEWLDVHASNNAPELETKALNYIIEVFPTYRSAPEEVDLYQQYIANPASLGDPTGVQGYVDANCLPATWRATD